LVGSLEPVAAPGDFELRLRARIASDRPSEQTGLMQGVFHLLTSTPAIVSAALIVIVAVSLVWFGQRNGVQRALTASAPIKEVPGDPKPTQVAVKQTQTAGSLNTDKGRGSQPDRLAKYSRDTNSKVAQSGVKATDYGVSPAEIVRRGEPKAGEVSLSAPLNPMVVSMQDVHGATRRISLPPVSFGAQRLVDNRVPVSFSPNSRSW
jgi:hypothetical protein